MGRFWLILGVVFYPITASPYLFWRTDRFSALISGCIVALVLWLYALPRDLVWSYGSTEILSSRFALPLTAYLCGLIVASILMSFTAARR
jgi:hypothetical protein